MFKNRIRHYLIQRESPGTNVEALKDLVGDNTGPLTEPYNLDKG